MVAAAPLIVDSRNAVKDRHPHVFRIGASNTKVTEQLETSVI
jgi:hypothetical protein